MPYLQAPRMTPGPKLRVVGRRRSVSDARSSGGGATKRQGRTSTGRDVKRCRRSCQSGAATASTTTTADDALRTSTADKDNLTAGGQTASLRWCPLPFVYGDDGSEDYASCPNPLPTRAPQALHKRRRCCKHLNHRGRPDHPPHSARPGVPCSAKQ